MNFHKFIHQIDNISVQMFLKTWKDTLKTNDIVKIEVFLNDSKTQDMVQKVKNYDESDFWFLHQNLRTYVSNNDLNMVKNLIHVGLDINLDLPMVLEFFQSINRHKKENVLVMMELLIEGGLNLYNSNYKPWGVSPIHNVLFDIQNDKYHHFNKSLPYLSEQDDNKFIQNHVLYDILKLIKKQISHISLNDEENLVSLAIETKSQAVMREIVSMPNMTYEYIQIGLKKANNSEAYPIIDSFWAEIEKNRLNNQMQGIENNSKKIKI